MKRSLIAYEPPYGGQSYKIHNPIKVLEEFNNFLSMLTDSDKIPEVELTVFESPKGQQYYQSDKLIEKAKQLFSVGQRKLWLTGVREEYQWSWQLSHNDLGKAISFLMDSLKEQKYYVGPVELLLTYNFKWIDFTTKKEYQFDREDYWFHNTVSQNTVLLFLSKTNTIIPSFYFPFQQVTDEFLALKSQIDQLVSVDLKEKNFRIWIPKKNKEGYIRRKIDERKWR